MAITATQIKELRAITQAPMMECKKALTITDWDIDGAIQELRKAWITKAAKRAGNETHEWKILIKTEWNKTFILSVACETDFVAMNENFAIMLNEMMDVFVSEWNIETSKTLLETIKNDNSLKMGENLVVTLDIIEWEPVWSYIHSNGKVAAVVIWVSGTDISKLNKVAMHATAMTPSFLKPSDVTEEEITKEKDLQLEMMKNDPKMSEKPDNVLLKIIEGKMNKFKNEQSLTSQSFVINPDLTVGQFIGEDSLVSFKNFNI